LLYCTSLLVMVASGDTPGASPRKLKLWNSQNKDTIAEIPFDSTVMTCRLNKSRLVVYIDIQQIHIFELATMNCIQILSTNNNAAGLLALSSEAKSYLAFPGYPGRVVLYDAANCRLLTQINAHKGNVAQIQFDRQGTLLATASETGTVIRVFSVPNGDLLYSFRRGIQHARINSLSFCPNSKFLSAGASSGTIHIFLLENRNIFEGVKKRSSSEASGEPGLASSSAGDDDVVSATGEGAEGSGWVDKYNTIKSSAVFGLMSAVKYVSSLNVLPNVAQEFVDSYRAICCCRLPGGEDDFKSAITIVSQQMKVVVVTPNGCVYRY
jgi:autophagy-related protein 18